MVIFHAVSWDFRIFATLEFCPIWAIEKVFWVIFALLTKTDLKACR